MLIKCSELHHFLLTTVAKKGVNVLFTWDNRDSEGEVWLEKIGPSASVEEVSKFCIKCSPDKEEEMVDWFNLHLGQDPLKWNIFIGSENGYFFTDCFWN